MLLIHQCEEWVFESKIALNSMRKMGIRFDYVFGIKLDFGQCRLCRRSVKFFTFDSWSFWVCHTLISLPRCLAIRKCNETTNWMRVWNLHVRMISKSVPFPLNLANFVKNTFALLDLQSENRMRYKSTWSCTGKRDQIELKCT